MKVWRRGLLLAVWLLGAQLGAAQSTQAGAGESFALLDRPTGARADALGSAYEGLADDASGVLWNAAAPAMARGFGAAFNHQTWLAGSAVEGLTLESPVNGWLSAAAFGEQVAYPAMALRNSQGQLSGYGSPAETAAGLGLALRHQDWALGLSGRWLHQDLITAQVSGSSYDGGLLWDARPGLRLGLQLRELPQLDGSYSSEAALGLSYGRRLGMASALLSASAVNDPAAGLRYGVGVELGWGPLAVRAGYALADASQGGLDQRVSLGLGLGVDHYSVDYAYVPWGDFGATHRLSLSWHVDRPSEPSAPVDAPAPTPQRTAVPAPAPLPAAAPVPLSPSATSSTRFLVLSDAVARARDLEAAGRGPEALKAYHDAVAQDNGDVEAWRGMARLYRKLGRVDYAASCWAQVLRLAPEDAEAKAAQP